MPPVNYGSHKKSPGTPSEYTDAQYQALNALKQRTPSLVYGAARNEFVNHVLRADGTIDTDLSVVRAALVQADQDDVTRLNAFTAQHKDDILRGTLSKDLLIELRDLQFWANHSQTDEFDDHVAQQRFLFVVDVDFIPRIYFQCVTPTNPDIEFVDPTQDPDHSTRQAAKDALVAARIARGG